MFTAAGHCVARASGMPWGEFVRKRILDPLDMTSTTVTYDDAQKAPDHASGHRMGKAGLEVMPWYPLKEPAPAGSICSSARDLVKWMQFQLGDGTVAGRRLISAANLTETHTPQIVIRMDRTLRRRNPETRQMSYGLGWLIFDYRGHLLLAHGGTIDGFRSYVILAPEQKLGIALLNNRDQTQMNLALANSLLDRLLDLPAAEDWNRYYDRVMREEQLESATKQYELLQSRRQDTKPSREQGAYAGTYEDAAYGTAEVKLENGTLIWSWSSFRQPLQHFEGDTFTFEDTRLGFVRVQFGVGDKGEVGTMKLLGSLDVTFRRKP
jgi:CubicO group peptidase (beta-lactamase class C family)